MEMCPLSEYHLPVVQLSLEDQGGQDNPIVRTEGRRWRETVQCEGGVSGGDGHCVQGMEGGERQEEEEDKRTVGEWRRAE